MFYKKISKEILDKIDSLTEPVVEEVYDRHQNILEDFTVEREELISYIGKDLKKLAESIDEMKPQIFANYIIWVRDTLLARGVELYTVENNYKTLLAIIRGEFPEDSYALIIGYFYAGLRELEKE